MNEKYVQDLENKYVRLKDRNVELLEKIQVLNNKVARLEKELKKKGDMR